MALDTKAWLKEIGFSDEKIAALAPDLEPFAANIEKGYLRQSDYSKSMNDLKKTQADLAAANDKLTADMAEWAELSAAEQKQAGALREELDASKTAVFKLTQKITRLAEDNGVDPKTVLEGEPPPEPKKKEPVAFDPTELTKGINDRIGGVANYLMTLSAEVDEIAREHEELTGQRFDRRAFIAGIKEDLAKGKTDNLDPVKRWEAAHDIPTKRSEKSVAQRKAELDAAREEGRTAALSEAALPNTHLRQGTHSPVLRSAATANNGQSKLQRPQPGQRMAGAVAALATGKYRNGGAAKTA